MAISKMTRRRGREPKIMVTDPLLTVLLAKDNGHYCAKCPELDLVTELPTADAALEDLIEAIRDYAKEYLRDRDRYATSPNRAHHVPYIEAIAACKADWELRTLIGSSMASLTYNDFRIVLKRAEFKRLRCLVEIKMLGCKT